MEKDNEAHMHSEGEKQLNYSYSTLQEQNKQLTLPRTIDMHSYNWAVYFYRWLLETRHVSINVC